MRTKNKCAILNVLKNHVSYPFGKQILVIVNYKIKESDLALTETCVRYENLKNDIAVVFFFGNFEQIVTKKLN